MFVEEKRAGSLLAAENAKASGKVMVLGFLLSVFITAGISHICGLFYDLPDFELLFENPEKIDFRSLCMYFGERAACLLAGFGLTAMLNGYALTGVRKGLFTARAFSDAKRVLPRCLALFLLVCLAVAAAGFGLAVLLLNVSPVLFSVLATAAAAAAVFLLYSLRYLLFVLYDRTDLGFFACIGSAFRISKGNRRNLFFLDLSFIWFSLLTGVISAAVSMIPDIALQVAEQLALAELAQRIYSAYGVLTAVFLFLGNLACIPLYYKKYAAIQYSHAMVYLRLRHFAETAEAHPLAFEE